MITDVGTKELKSTLVRNKVGLATSLRVFTILGFYLLARDTTLVG